MIEANKMKLFVFNLKYNIHWYKLYITFSETSVIRIYWWINKHYNALQKSTIDCVMVKNRQWQIISNLMNHVKGEKSNAFFWCYINTKYRFNSLWIETRSQGYTMNWWSIFYKKSYLKYSLHDSFIVIVMCKDV